MRHRAGIGLSEQSDAVVIIVSEETGSISVAIDGMLKRHLTASTLDKILHNELVFENVEDSRRGVIANAIRTLFKVKKDEQDESAQKTI